MTCRRALPPDSCALALAWFMLNGLRVHSHYRYALPTKDCLCLLCPRLLIFRFLMATTTPCLTWTRLEPRRHQNAPGLWKAARGISISRGRAGEGWGAASLPFLPL